MNQHQRVIIKALTVYKGDDLARAQLAFAGRTPEEMKKPWYNSGKTRAEILAGYEAHAAAVDAAVEWVKTKGDADATTDGT